jgi:hypothetical protein
MRLLWNDWGVLRSHGFEFPVILREEPDGAAPAALPVPGRPVVITCPTGDLDRLATLDEARVQMPSGACLTLDERTRTMANGHVAVVFALAREG